ncbi:MAG: AI-2E family transporter [Lachnospiraceae bacterium]
MDLSKMSIKKIRELIVFTALLVVALWKFDVVLGVLKTIWDIIFPFVLGGAIAFLTNVPMSFLEKKIFENVKKKNKIVRKLKRPISLILTIVLVVGVIALVMFGVIPQLTRTMGTLVTSINDFIPQMQSWIGEFFHNNQEIMNLVDQIEFDPDQAIKWGISLLGNGAGNMMNTTMSAVGSIVSGVATFFIAFSFACYILFQKEKLHIQIRKVFFAFLPRQKADTFLKVCSLTYRTFANFLAGQCLEAVILGSMFVVTLSILRMPYALLIGILIAFTALIPIFGAFIGCAVGSFLIFMVNPQQAILFVIVFLVLQQIEGNLIYPHVVGESVGLPSIWVLAAVTIGGNLMGIVGMLVFIPLLSVLYTIFREFVYLRLKKQNIKQVTKTEIEEYTKGGRYRRNRKKQTVIYLFFTQADILNKQDCALMTSLL